MTGWEWEVLDEWSYGEVFLDGGWIPTIFFVDEHGREWAVRLTYLDGE